MQCEENIKSNETTREIDRKIRKCEQGCHWRCDETKYETHKALSMFPTPEVMAWFFTAYVFENPQRDKLLAWKHFTERIARADNKTAQDYLFHRTNVSESHSRVTQRMEDWISSSFARVNVYFEDAIVVRKRQIASYRWNDLLADVGGTLGLWVGISVITVFEILTLLTEILLMISSDKQKGSATGTQKPVAA